MFASTKKSEQKLASTVQPWQVLVTRKMVMGVKNFSSQYHGFSWNDRVYNYLYKIINKKLTKKKRRRNSPLK